ncbi:unknown [Candidatus Colimorpha enterica]|uniref:Uncharacterized protein n=1 Tax=Candidatus Colimorpha enterica TaxID=3083063 RepID=R6V2V8_9BACT|nr:unknown [Candidatus Colimorpha enterica]
MYVHVKSVQGHGAEPPPCRNRENRKTVKNARTPESSRVTGTASFFLGKEKEGGGGGIDDLQL